MDLEVGVTANIFVIFFNRIQLISVSFFDFGSYSSLEVSVCCLTKTVRLLVHTRGIVRSGSGRVERTRFHF